MKDNSGLRKQIRYADNPSIVPFDIKAVEEILKPLVGLPLSDVWHPFGQSFEFGIDIAYSYRGKPSVLNEISVKACDGWMLSKGAIPIMGSGDHKGHGARRFYDRKTKPRDYEAGLRWKRAKAFFDSVDKKELLVIDFLAGNDAYLEIGLTNDYRIRMMQVSSDQEWLYIKNKILLKSLFAFDGMMIYRDLEQEALVNTPRKVEENPIEKTK
jgi:hypothetical protein